MTRFLLPKHLFVPMFLLIGLTLAPVAAEQGHSPFAESTPDSTPVAVASPVAPTTSSGWEIVESRPIEVDGEPVALSPDGQWIAGIGPDREVCVWETASLIPTCAPRDDDATPNTQSLRWSPDSTAVAFTLDAARLVIDSDVYVFDVETGELTNLTEDDFSGNLILDAKERPETLSIDLGVTWSADSQTLFFGRTHWTEPQQQPEILSIGRTGGEPEVLATLDTESPWGVVFPMVALPDGTIVYTINNGNPDDASEGLWALLPSGESTQLLSGSLDAEFPMPVAIDARQTADGLMVTGFSGALAGQFSGERPYSFTVNVDTGDVVPGEAFQTPSRFLPSGDSTVFMQTDGRDATLVVQTAGETELLGTVPRSRYEQSRGIEWSTADTILLVQGGSDATLVTMAPSS